MVPEEYDKSVSLSTNRKGYQWFIDHDHPLSGSQGIVLYHRHVASVKEGRWLDSEEDVHHINEVKDCNLDWNLEIMSREEHTSLHSRDRSKGIFTTKEELEGLVWSYPSTEVGRLLNISDVAVGKRCKRLGIKKPPRGYWRRLECGLI